MVNKVFIILLAALVGNINASDNDQVSTEIVTFDGSDMQSASAHHSQVKLLSEKSLRKQLYWLDKNNPFFYKLDSFQKDLDYYIAILTEHIKVLENKITTKRSCLKSTGMIYGLFASGLSGLCAYGAYSCYHKAAPQDKLVSSIVVAAMSAVYAGIAGNQFYRVSRHAERLVERLERDKRILAILEKEKAAACTNPHKLNNVITEMGLPKVAETFLGAIDSVLKLAAAA